MEFQSVSEIDNPLVYVEHSIDKYIVYVDEKYVQICGFSHEL